MSRYSEFARRVVENATPWTFPLLLAAAVVAIDATFLGALTLSDSAFGDDLAGPLTWAIAATVFATVFVFAIAQCHILMFRCGQGGDAVVASVAVTCLGILCTVVATYQADWHVSSLQMRRLLDATAFSSTAVKTLASALDGFACWSALAIIATSCTILRNESGSQEELSRQIRGSRILLNVSSALLIARVAEVSALYAWPAHELGRVASCCSEMLKSTSDEATLRAFHRNLQISTTALATVTGTTGSLILAAAYLPLGVILRQRAYRLVKPWDRTEAWLVMHGVSLQPMQQLGKVVLMLGPIIASGPLATLARFISQ